MRTAVFVISIAACTPTGPAPNATLAELTTLELRVQGWQASDTEPTSGVMTLAYDQTAFRNSHHDQCAVLDLTGTLNGATIAIGTPGGPNNDFDECYPPSFELAALSRDSSSFVVGDHSLTITAEFAADALAPRTPTLQSPSTWQFAAGDMVTIGWSDPGDLIGLQPGQMTVYFSTDTVESPNAFDLDPQFTGATIRFTVPNPAPVTGPGSIAFDFGYSTGGATTCTGATSCTFSATRGAIHSAVIAHP